MENREAIIQRAAAAYQTNPALLDAVNRRENSGRLTFDYNRTDSNARAGIPSAGPWQFIESTYRSYADQAKKANPGAWRGVSDSWDNPQAQALAASWAFANGKGSAWTTYKDALKDAGGAKGAGGTTAPVPAAKPSYGLLGSGGGKSVVSGLLGDDDKFLKDLLDRHAARQGSAPARAAPLPTPAAAPAASSGGVPARKPGETGQQYLDRVLQGKFGLKHDPGNNQTTGGGHARGSDHYSGKATDFGNGRNAPAVLQAAEDYLEANAQALGLSQSLYGEEEADGHGNHLHASTLRAAPGRKTKF